eukprot:TRINITY_DN16159_c0_g2_i1.p1 TRINITY_DN16159_c0_g2~~TRINITY_DN16159_c0_g2_i1.p1  ORF type:complete len:708 (-),score=143.85 TRINITY_DN16159_c0_g2_i1:75-2153(-)
MADLLGSATGVGYALLGEEAPASPAIGDRSSRSRRLAVALAAGLAACGLLATTGGGEAPAVPWTPRPAMFAANPEKSTGIAFCGGGFRAHAVGVGWLAGMVAGTGQKVGEIMTAPAVASNSGGSWFTGSLMYSKNFNNMLELMGADPARAALTFKAKWGNEWKRVSSDGDDHIPEEVACCSKKGFMDCGWGANRQKNEIIIGGETVCCGDSVVGDCRMKGYFPCGTANIFSKSHGLPKEVLFGESRYCCPADSTAGEVFDRGDGCLKADVRKNLVWGLHDLGSTIAWFIFDQTKNYEDIIGKMLEIPGDMNASSPLSAVPVDWAKGKDYFVAQSFLTPTEHAQSVMMGVHISVFDNLLTAAATGASRELLKSWPCNGELCASEIPARFSATLGAIPARSPAPITSDAAKEALVDIEYRKLTRLLGTLWYKTDKTVVGSRDLSDWHASHKVPIKYAVGGSSALLGSLNVLGGPMLGSLAKFIPTWVQARFTAGEVPVMAAADLGIANFQAAKQLLKDHDLEGIATRHTLEITDAGQIDNTGVVHLLAAGHDNVVSIYNTAGFSPRDYKVMVSFHQLLSGNPETVTKASGFPVFKEDMYEVASQLESFDVIHGPPDATELSAIWAGELHLTTVESPPHGIEGGRSVTVRMVIGDGKTISCCGLDINQYGIFAGEMVQAFAANPDFAKKIRDWFP